MKYGARTIAIALLVVGSLIGIFFAASYWQRGTANFRGETEQIERTRANADFRIQSYEWFFDHCAAIETTEGQILVQEEELETAAPERADRIRTNLVAIKNRRIDLITTYNGEARKEKTTGQFRDAGLPSRININNYETECE